jgi:transposase-like protein
MGIFNKDNNSGAYSGKLTCPACFSPAIRFIENVGPYRLRYRCRKCGQFFQYETGKDLGIHPYAPFKKHWRGIVDGKITPQQFLQQRELKK